jgi:hypothetical protein
MNINFITSFLFLLTALYSWYRNVILICISCSLCFISSIIYHGCLEYNITANILATTKPTTTIPATTTLTTLTTPIHPNIISYIRIVDIIVCNTSTIIFILVSIGFNIWYLFGLLCAYYNYFIYYKCKLSTCPIYGDYWHSTLHLVGNIGILCMVESCLFS